MTGRLPRGIRNNNPGNLDFADQPGARLETGVPDPRFAAFPTMDDGIRALRDQLLRYAAHGMDTIAAIIDIYAPPIENATGAYIAVLCRRMGARPDTVLDLRDAATMRALVEGITTMENGPGHVSAAQIDHALRATPGPAGTARG
ncbi:structural protein [Komagataeibacter swingsii]|uniref:Structural protein n=1 Tax=Komagataeibacter swingsii TaxID=215220 RepID=A0A2V4S679_9PROT|nr:structural protein [Komagataeibacter swingsii]PYD70629.1 structural protein [Komagataeibacter swingsii]GBQ58842.1 bacteriophage protein [Komagataeibacter swingsii DSM 16373]